MGVLPLQALHALRKASGRATQQNDTRYGNATARRLNAPFRLRDRQGSAASINST